jgi:hypothetical protein
MCTHAPLCLCVCVCEELVIEQRCAAGNRRGCLCISVEEQEDAKVQWGEQDTYLRGNRTRT